VGLRGCGCGCGCGWVDPWTVDGWISTGSAQRIPSSTHIMRPVSVRFLFRTHHVRHESTARLSTPPGSFQSTPPLVVLLLPRLVAVRHKNDETSKLVIDGRRHEFYGVREKQLAPCTHR
jgi:hypothetical protein